MLVSPLTALFKISTHLYVGGKKRHTTIHTSTYTTIHTSTYTTENGIIYIIRESGSNSLFRNDLSFWVWEFLVV